MSAEPFPVAAAPTTAVQSYLNNDNIDELKPEPRKRHVSSISLSDQYVESFPSLLALDKSNTTQAPDFNNYQMKTLLQPSRMSFSNMSSASPVHLTKDKIDHERVASYAFAFDIDGVLVRGPETIPYAVEAIKYLDGENPYNIKVPYIFVTNGGGKHESIRAQDLSSRLKTEVHVNQVVQGHTPMKELSNVYKNVLVVGGVGNTCRNIAKTYGFNHVYTPHDIMRWDPSVTPYYDMNEEDFTYCDEDHKDVDFSKTKIDAIMVFADSRNWAADQQIILELLMSKDGYMGSLSDNFEDGPPIYFAHSDFVWSTNYRLVRYGMGALQVSIAALFKEHTGKELKVIRFGKPQRRTFKFAEKVLHDWRKNVLETHIDSCSTEDNTTNTSDIFSNDAVFSDTDNEDSINESEGLTLQGLTQLRKPSRTNSIASQDMNLPPPSTVYFVGDTPESDIRFANSHDESWFSILVKTGVYQEGSTPKYAPKQTCDNVLEAVKFAVEREHARELEEWNRNAISI